MFQFQYGSIKSQQTQATSVHPHCFNSNMVRLKEMISIDWLQIYCEFQFQYGSIKSSGVLQIKPSQLSFNSNMVRLKVIILIRYLLIRIVSIPIWFD